MIKNIIKNIIIFIVGGICFETVYFLTEYMLLKYFGIEETFYLSFKREFLGNIIVYVGIYCCFYIINFIYNYFAVKKLNDKLKIFKERRKNKNL